MGSNEVTLKNLVIIYIYAHHPPNSEFLVVQDRIPLGMLARIRQKTATSKLNLPAKTLHLISIICIYIYIHNFLYIYDMNI